MSDDRALGMNRKITRRDFINGVGAAIGGSMLAPEWTYGLEQLSNDARADPYPPALTGMRGSHPGSFEAAHAMRDGRAWENPEPTGERYDMIVVGAGLSGLSSGYFFQSSAGSSSRVLLLDNHDDFGGHAKRNEFTHGDRTLMLNGGTSNLESTGVYSTVARTLLSAIGIDLDRALAADRTSSAFYDSMNLGRATFFAREVFGTDRYVRQDAGGLSTAEARRVWLAKTPLDPRAQADLVRLNDPAKNVDYLGELDDGEKKLRLAKMSYKAFLEDAYGVHPHTVAYLNDGPKGLFCVGIDAYPALYAWASGDPGFAAMRLEPFSRVGPLLHMGGGQHGRENEWGSGPTINFPDGNATVARLLVRALIPQAVPGSTMEDVIMSRVRYDILDDPSNRAQIRLNSTVVNVQHLGDPESAQGVRVTYIQNGQARTAEAGHVVMACWNAVIPHICPELSDEQKSALGYGEKMPIVYTNVALRNWRAFAELGVQNISCPGMYHTGFGLGRAIDIGDYQPPRSPDDPMVLHMTRTPCAPGRPKKEQHRLGRQDLLSTSFETFERNIRDQLGRGLAGTDFDPARDVVAITVNRWPHGYAYSYDTLEDPVEWALFAPEDRPCVIGRRRFGRISIANSDAAATPHTDAAINQGHRAAREQLAIRGLAPNRTAE